MNESIIDEISNKAEESLYKFMKIKKEMLDWFELIIGSEIYSPLSLFGFKDVSKIKAKIEDVNKYEETISLSYEDKIEEVKWSKVVDIIKDYGFVEE